MTDGGNLMIPMTRYHHGTRHCRSDNLGWQRFWPASNQFEFYVPSKVQTRDALSWI